LLLLTQLREVRMSEIQVPITWLIVGLGFVGLLLIAWRIADNDMKSRRLMRWDKQFEADVKAGKLDNIANQAIEDFKAGKAKEL